MSLSYRAASLTLAIEAVLTLGVDGTCCVHRTQSATTRLDIPNFQRGPTRIDGPSAVANTSPHVFPSDGLRKMLFNYQFSETLAGEVFENSSAPSVCVLHRLTVSKHLACVNREVC